MLQPSIVLEAVNEVISLTIEQVLEILSVMLNTNKVQDWV